MHSYKQGTLQSISSLYNTNFGARLLFTFYGEMYVQIEEGSNTFSKMGKCSDCPDGKTSPSGATSVYECVCGSSTYFSYETGKCEIVKESCPEGQFFSRDSTETSDRECLPCPVCPLGFYRDPEDCKSNRVRDPSLPARCVKCESCQPGQYINPLRCNGANSHSSRGVNDYCLPCGGKCKDMQNIVGDPCLGKTIYNSQSCQQCTASCPVGMTISTNTERCSGNSWKQNELSSVAAFDPLTECTPCDPCTK
jgi:hypothetical protein